MFFAPKSIVFTNSELCNLQCKYCFITQNQTDKSYYLEQQKKITQALEDKSYINNYLIALNRLNYSPNNIEAVELWGQETTLNLESFFKNFDYLYSVFPNLKTILFSTNGVAHTDKIVESIKLVDNIVNKKIEFRIQYSYDGIFSKENRGVEESVIINNILYLIDNLNSIKLKNTEVHLHLHNVISKELMLTLNSFEEVDRFWTLCQEAVNKILQNNMNNKVFITPYICPAMEMPITATKKEGQKYAEFWENSMTSNFGKQPISALINKMSKGYYSSEKFNMNFKDLMNKLINFDYNDKEFYNLFMDLSRQCGCNSQVASFKMAYDGTLWYCQNVMYLLREEDCNISNDNSMPYFKSLIKHNRYVNILKDDIEDIKKNIQIYLEYSITSFGQMFSSTINMMAWCAKAGLIQSSYRYNNEKLLKHALILSFVQGCYHNNIIETGTIYGRSADLIIAYCNGIADMIEDNLIYDKNFYDSLKEGR